MNNKNKQRDFKVLSDREHVILRAGMYLGQTVLTKKDRWVLDKDTNKFSYGTVEYVPALIKCFSEAVDNAVDVAVDYDFKLANKIDIKVDNKSFSVIDNGCGIPVKNLKDTGNTDPSQTCACLAWTQLRAGTSFDDDGRYKVGTNGMGVALANIFSKKFVATSDDGTHRQTITCTNNLQDINPGKILKTTGKSGCNVYFEPDLEKFGISDINDTHQQLIYQIILNLAISYPKIRFTFNGKVIKISAKNIAEMFTTKSSETETFENGTVVVFPNESDEFQFYTSVNGIMLIRGGTHVDYITNQLVGPIRDKLAKKFKDIRPGDIKNKFAIAIFLTKFPNVAFDSQTKESLSNLQKDVISYLGNTKINFETFAKKILKNDEIVFPIIETFKIKEELKTRQLLKKTKKIKISSDKYMPSIGDKKYLSLTEGLSAKASVSSILGRNGFAYYAMRGLPINCYTSSMQKLSANQEFKDIINILDLDITNNNTREAEQEPIKKEISFEKVLITTDADCYHEDSKVIVFDGIKAIKDITYDDLVLSKDGNYYQITDIVKKTVKSYIAIRFSKSPTDFILTTPEQKIILADNTVVKAKELVAGNVMICRKIAEQEKNKTELIPCEIHDISHVRENLTVAFYDITVASPDHSFFIKLQNDTGDRDVLVHNCDGSHLTSMILGWFKKFAPNLFHEKRICRLTTPIVIIEDKKTSKIKYFFLNLPEYKKWEAEHSDEISSGKYICRYQKGLGSMSREQFSELIDKYGLDRFIQTYVLDEDGEISINNWLGADVTPRKTALREFSFDINNA